MIVVCGSTSSRRRRSAACVVLVVVDGGETCEPLRSHVDSHTGWRFVLDLEEAHVLAVVVVVMVGRRRTSA
jgi:hypothetical protein